MGSGFRLIGAGENPTAANLNNYLSKQVVMTFATTTARDAAVTSPEEGMVAAITDDDLLTVYTGSAWVEYGRYGAWQSWTPTLTASTTNPSLGSGGFYQVTGRYMRLGSLVIGYALMIAGNTGVSAGSGTYRFPLPVTPAGANIQIGTGYTTATSVNGYAGMLRLGSGIQDGELWVNGAAWTASNPITNGTQIRLHFTYEAA